MSLSPLDRHFEVVFEMTVRMMEDFFFFFWFFVYVFLCLILITIKLGWVLVWRAKVPGGLSYYLREIVTVESS